MYVLLITCTCIQYDCEYNIMTAVKDICTYSRAFALCTMYLLFRHMHPQVVLHHALLLCGRAPSHCSAVPPEHFSTGLKTKETLKQWLNELTCQYVHPKLYTYV